MLLRWSPKIHWPVETLVSSLENFPPKFSTPFLHFQLVFWSSAEFFNETCSCGMISYAIGVPISFVIFSFLACLEAWELKILNMGKIACSVSLYQYVMMKEFMPNLTKQKFCLKYTRLKRILKKNCVAFYLFISRIYLSVVVVLSSKCWGLASR